MLLHAYPTLTQSSRAISLDSQKGKGGSAKGKGKGGEMSSKGKGGEMSKGKGKGGERV